MTKEDLWNSPDIVPALRYSDLVKTVEWFERVFGFRERSEARLTWPGGGMAWIEVGSGLFKIAALIEGSDADSATPGLMIKAYVDDVDQHYARAKAEGARIVRELEDEFWGGRIYRVLDLEGHVWEISQKGRDLAAERWELPPGLTRGWAK
jgi:uncharacterized glyoxalase superfamily protein PhnB